MFSNKQLIYTSLLLVHWLLLIGSGLAASSAVNNSINIDSVVHAPAASNAAVGDDPWKKTNALSTLGVGAATANGAAIISGTVNSTGNPSNSSMNSTLDRMPKRQANGFNLAINQKDANNPAQPEPAESINSQISNSTNISASPTTQTTSSVQSNGSSAEAAALSSNSLSNQPNLAPTPEPANGESANRETAAETMAMSTTNQNKSIVKKESNEQSNNAPAGEALTERPLTDVSKQGTARQDNTSSLIEDKLVTNEKQPETALGNQSLKGEPASSSRTGEKQSVGLLRAEEPAKNESLQIDRDNRSTEPPAVSSPQPLQDGPSKRWKKANSTINHAANQTEKRTIDEVVSQAANQTIKLHSSSAIVLTNRSTFDQMTTGNLVTESSLLNHEQSNRSFVSANGMFLDQAATAQPLHLSNAEPLISGAPHSGDQQHWMIPSQPGMLTFSSFSMCHLCALFVIGRWSSAAPPR